jgi:uncharacterized protein (TIGR02145 family)
MRNLKLIIAAICFLIVLSSKNLIKGSENSNEAKSNITDTIRIGTQTWTAHNSILPAPNSFWYERDSIKYRKYGKLYFFSGAMAACPKGWHLPSNEEWQTLIDFVGGDSLAVEALMEGGSAGLNLTAAGYRSSNSENDLFAKFGEYGFYWTSTVRAEQTAYGKLFVKGKKLENQFYRRANAFSVRYIKD